MRYKALILIVTLSLLAFSAAAADLTGKWTGTWEAVNNPRGPITDAHYMTLKQNGASITGTTGPKPDVQWDIKNALLEGNKLTFDVTAGSFDLGFELVVDGDGLAGTVVAKNRAGISWKVRMTRDK